jgi:hypothetical protein
MIRKQRELHQRAFLALALIFPLLLGLSIALRLQHRIALRLTRALPESVP